MVKTELCLVKTKIFESRDKTIINNSDMDFLKIKKNRRRKFEKLIKGMEN